MSEPRSSTPAPDAPLGAAPPAAPSMLLSLLAGAAVPLVLPSGFLVFLLRADSLRDAWLEGGAGMWATLGVTAAVGFVAALLVVFAARVSAVAASPLPALIAVPALVGMGFSRAGIDGSMRAVEHAAPADRATILFASVSEAVWTSTLGGLLAGGLALAIALGLGVGAVARTRDAVALHRDALLFGALVAGGLAAAGLVGGLAVRALGDAYVFVAQGYPVEQLLPLVHRAESWSKAHALASLVAAVLALVGAKRLRASRSSTLAFGLSTLFGLGLLAATVRPAVPGEVVEVLAKAQRTSARLVELEAPSASMSEGFELGDLSPDEVKVQLAQHLERWRALRVYALDVEQAPLALQVSVDTTAATLAAALESAAREGQRSVVLLTTFRTGALDALPPPFNSVERGLRGVTVELGYRGDTCTPECPAASLDAEALAAGGERWPLEAGAGLVPSTNAGTTWLPLEPREPRLLLRAALTAMVHGRRLGLLLEGQAPKLPEASAGEEPGAGAPAPVRARCEVTSVRAQGALAVKKAREELASSLGDLAACAGESLEEVALPTTAQLQLAVGSDGEVLGVEVGGVRDAGLRECLAFRARQLTFSAPPSRAMSIVTVELALKPAP